MRGLFGAVAELQGVRVEPVLDLRNAGVDALILIDPSMSLVEEAVQIGVRVCAFFGATNGHELNANSAIRFGSSAFLDSILRGQQLRDCLVPTVLPVPGDAGEILAMKGCDPVWMRVQLSGGTADLVGYCPPELTPHEYLFQHFKADHFMCLLPLIHFVREVAGQQSWQRPSPRACLMFDDPNLHWPSFGYIDYRSVIASARAYNYHVAFATIPLDCWLVHKQAARLFRDNRDRISLLVHGNNHTKNELAQPGVAGDEVRTVAQALKRIDRFERVSALRIFRVMAAPHGACSYTMSRTLLDLGFDAACISRGSLMRHNPGFEWPATVGMNLGEFLVPGLPIFPRFRLGIDNNTEIILAAFIGQAMILVGHHQDLRDGIEVLEEVAKTVNALGRVSWSNVDDIVRSSYLWRVEDDMTEICVFSRDARVCLPEGTTNVVLNYAWNNRNSAAMRIEQSNSHRINFDATEGPWIFDGSKTIQLQNKPAARVNYRDVSAGRRKSWPVVRRLLTEGRDRLLPVISRSARLFSA
jgi:hypothetical protein